MIRKLTFSQLSRKKGRTFGIALIVAALSLVMLAGFIIILSLNSGLNSLSDRMGADLMIVPLGYESGAEGVLIKGEPSYFYFDKSVLADIEAADIEGIDKITTQFYLTSSSQGCCDIPVQFIGIDEASDFTVLPWIKETLPVKSSVDGNIKGTHFLDTGVLVVGSDIDIPTDGKLKFFDEYYTVSGQLEKTGTGLDQTVFSNVETTLSLFEAARKKGFSFTDNIDPENSISTIMIKVKEGYTPTDVKHDLRTKFDGLQIIETKSLSNSIRGSLSGFVVLLYILIVMLLVLTFIILSVTFRLSIKERTREFMLMRTVGATKKQIYKLILRESILICLFGTITGIILASVFIFPFANAISTAVSIPFLLPKVSVTILLIAIVLVIGTFSGPVSAIGSMRSISRISVYEAGKIN